MAIFIHSKLQINPSDVVLPVDVDLAFEVSSSRNDTPISVSYFLPKLSNTFFDINGRKCRIFYINETIGIHTSTIKTSVRIEAGHNFLPNIALITVKLQDLQTPSNASKRASIIFN